MFEFLSVKCRMRGKDEPGAGFNEFGIGAIVFDWSTISVHLSSSLVNPCFTTANAAIWFFVFTYVVPPTVILAKRAQGRNLPYVLGYFVYFKRSCIQYNGHNSSEFPFRLKCLQMRKTSILQHFFASLMMLILLPLRLPLYMTPSLMEEKYDNASIKIEFILRCLPPTTSRI